MQPYFMPYIGYFQLINSADIFVITDNMQYTKKGWFNRNRILDNGSERIFTLPIRKDRHDLNVNERFLANNVMKEKNKILSQIKSLYAKAPYFKTNYHIVRKPFLRENINLFDFIYHSIIDLCSVLEIKTELKVLSSLDINHSLKAKDRILEVCNFLGCKTYINSIGGKELYDKETFKVNNVYLKFLKSKDIEYKQFNHPFVPWLSIIDVLMFNDIETIKGYLNEYELE